MKLFTCKSENWSFRFILSTLNNVQLNSIMHFTSLGAWLACSTQATFVRCRGVIARIAAARFPRIRWRRVANFTLVSGQHPATAIANTINYWRCGFGSEFLWANSHWPKCQRSRPARTTWGSGPYKPRAPKTSKTSTESMEHLGKESQIWKDLDLVFDMNVYVLIIYLILSSIKYKSYTCPPGLWSLHLLGFMRTRCASGVIGPRSPVACFSSVRFCSFLSPSLQRIESRTIKVFSIVSPVKEHAYVTV